MASENRFVYNPSTLDINVSKWNMNNRWQGSIYHGDLVPVEVTKVYPGDRFNCKLAAFIRTATNPIAPIMDNIKASFASFFIPLRLVWTPTKKFYGEAEDGYGIQSEVLQPRDTSGAQTEYSGSMTTGRSLAAYLGLVRSKASPTTHTPINVNVLRCFYQVYNDWFRNENLQAPYLWNHGQTGDGSIVLATLNGNNINASTLTTDSAFGSIPKVCKQLDRFTSCLPWSQKASSAVLLPLGAAAPVYAGVEQPVSGYKGYGIKFAAGLDSAGTAWGYPVNSRPIFAKSASGELIPTTGSIPSGTELGALTPTNLYADLSLATASTINQLRMAFATQRYFETLARTGSKYREYIKGIFGVNIGDTTAQMAEYLGGFSVNINVDQVLQTTGYAAGNTTALGAPGAISVSGASNFLYHKAFTEPGYVVTVMYTKHTRTYGQGLDDLFKHHEIWDEYNPKFANIGEQALDSSCLRFTGEAADDAVKFGFQEAWSHERYKKDMVVGLLAPSNSSSFNFWNLAENYSATPTLNSDFVTEDRANIERCLAGGAASPDYFVDLLFERTVVRPMPLYSIPGLIDHH